MASDAFPPLPAGQVEGESQGNGANAKSLYSRVAGLNTSVRDKKNVLEVRLEKSESSAKFILSDEEAFKLLKCLKISVNDCEAVQVCPIGKGVVYITLKPNVDISQFLSWRNESFTVKEGIQTGRIAQ